MAKATVDRPAGSDDASEPRRLTAQGLERKQQLLDCAAELFAERGYADTRVLDIVRHAGVAKGLFYWYFENKEALFRELVDPPPPGAAQGAGQRDGPGGRAAAPHPPGRGGLGRAPCRPTRRSSPCSRSRTRTSASPTCCARAPRSTWPTPRGSCRRASPTAPSATRTRSCSRSASSARSPTTATSTAPGAADLPVAELAAFVGRFVVRSLAADEEIAVRVLRA